MSFATSLCCIDGRIQGPLSEWIRKNYSVDYVDTITEPGLDKRISAAETASALRAKATISVRAHKSETIIVSGHHDCAANPGTKEEHRGQIAEAVKIIESWNLGADVAGVWVGEDWSVSRA